MSRFDLPFKEIWRFSLPAPTNGRLGGEILLLQLLAFPLESVLPVLHFVVNMGDIFLASSAGIEIMC